MRKYILLVLACCFMVPMSVFGKFSISDLDGGSKRSDKEKRVRSKCLLGKHKKHHRHRGKDYNVEVSDIAASDPNSLQLDLQISSSVPVNVCMKNDRLVVEQMCEKDVKSCSKRCVSQGKVLAVDMSKLEGKSSCPYAAPAWPLYVPCFNDKDNVDVRVSYEHAGNAFSSSGHSQDLSKLIFGECPMRVRDILLVSKLVERGDVLDYSSCGATGGYLAGVAPQQLCFDAEYDEMKLVLNYVRHFLDNDISLGVSLPFVWKKNCLSLTTSTNQMAVENAAFQALYGDDFNAFVEDILKAKGSSLTRHDEEKGLGDVEVFLSYEIPCRKLERLSAGFKVLFPTARERNVHKLWEPELGNGGFTELSAYLSGLWSKHRFFNLHGLIQGTYGFAAEVPRRIPSCKENPEQCGTGMNALGQVLAMGDRVRIQTEGSFKSLDTTFRRFATETEFVKIRRGSEAFVQVGNIFKKILFNRDFFDLYYLFRIKGSDYISDTLLDSKFHPEILKRNTYQLEHRVGFAYRYQFDDHVRAMLGARYAFSGRNIPKAFGVDFTISSEF